MPVPGQDETTVPADRGEVVKALADIQNDAEELAKWASEVQAALDRGDDDAAAELGEHVEAILDYTSRVRTVEEWAAAQRS